jgi:hypothetical protein
MKGLATEKNQPVVILDLIVGRTGAEGQVFHASGKPTPGPAIACNPLTMEVYHMALDFWEQELRRLEELVAHLDRAWSESWEYVTEARDSQIEEEYDLYGWSDSFDESEPTPEYRFSKVLSFAKALVGAVSGERLKVMTQPEVAPLFYYAHTQLKERATSLFEAVIEGNALVMPDEKGPPRKAKAIARKSLEYLAQHEELSSTEQAKWMVNDFLAQQGEEDEAGE